ncbi:MAG: sigma-70 family RNA polymerase sigma factor [Nitrospirales bacterium]
MPSIPNVTELLVGWSQGDQGALDQLLPLVYGELRRLARRSLRHERPNHTLQTTALVHEAYLRLVDQKSANWRNQVQFFAVASQLMRRILVDYARNHDAARRGGGGEKLVLDEAMIVSREKSVDLKALDESLKSLAALDPHQGRVVELRVFGGLTVEETAEVLGVSPRTVKREWSMAKAWLHRQISKQ